MKKLLVGITGGAGAGKDSAAAILLQQFDFERRMFAAPLKRMICAGFGVDMADWDSLDWKQAENPNMFGHTPRYLAQTLGTEWGRGLISDGIWADLAMRDLPARTVFTDVRFDNEAEAIRKRGGIVLSVVRHGPSIGSDHASEGGVSEDLIDWAVTNNGSVSNLQEEVLYEVSTRVGVLSTQP